MIRSHSPVARIGIQAASPLALVIGVYLLFVGHNKPGGGFAAGLVFGAVLALRTIVGLQRPRGANRMIAWGVLIVTVLSASTLVWGETLLDQVVISYDVPLLGKVKSGSALLFDIGVTTIVVGLILAVLDGLGAPYLSEPSSAAPSATGSTATSGESIVEAGGQR